MNQRIRNCRTLNGICVIISLALILATLFMVFTYKNASTALCFSSKNIDDPYGKLDRNTTEIISKSLNKAMNKTHVPFYFSFLYEHMNVSYVQNFEDNAIIIYYNKTTNVIGFVAKEIENDYSASISSQEELANIFEEFVSNVANNVKKDYEIKYYSSEKDKKVFSYLSLGVLAFLIVVTTVTIFSSIKKIRRNNMIIRRTIREEKIRRERRRQAATQRKTDL